MVEALDPTKVRKARETSRATRRVLVKKVAPPKPIKKYLWLAGHGMTLFFGTVYFAFYSFKWLHHWYWSPVITYRLAIIGVLLSYSVTVVTTFGVMIPNYHTLLATENFQSLLLACVWLISRNSAFKLLPYFIIALLQISSEFKVNAILKLDRSLSDLIAMSELVVIVALLFDTLLFRGTSGYALTIYLLFYWLRINFSPYTQVYILKLIKIVDDKVMKNQKPEVQKHWQTVKDFIEFRRSQTKRAIDVNAEYEPEVKDTSSHPDAGKSQGKAEMYNLPGQEPPSKNGKNQGVIVNPLPKVSPFAKADKGEAPAGTADNLDQTYDKNFKAGVSAMTGAFGAGVGAGSYSVGAKVGRQKNEVGGGDKIYYDDKPIANKNANATSGENNNNNNNNNIGAQDDSTIQSQNGSQIVAPASGRISAPSTSVQQPRTQSTITNSTDSRASLINHAQQIKKQQGQELTELERIQKMARDGVEQTQR